MSGFRQGVLQIYCWGWFRGLEGEYLGRLFRGLFSGIFRGCFRGFWVRRFLSLPPRALYAVYCSLRFYSVCGRWGRGWYTPTGYPAEAVRGYVWRLKLWTRTTRGQIPDYKFASTAKLQFVTTHYQQSYKLFMPAGDAVTNCNLRAHAFHGCAVAT